MKVKYPSIVFLSTYLTNGGGKMKTTPCKTTPSAVQHQFHMLMARVKLSIERIHRL